MCFFIILFPLAEMDVVTNSELLLLLDPNSYSRQEITLEKMAQGLQYNLISAAPHWLEFSFLFPSPLVLSSYLKKLITFHLRTREKKIIVLQCVLGTILSLISS